MVLAAHPLTQQPCGSNPALRGSGEVLFRPKSPRRRDTFEIAFPEGTIALPKSAVLRQMKMHENT